MPVSEATIVTDNSFGELLTDWDAQIIEDAPTFNTDSFALNQVSESTQDLDHA